MEMNKDKRYPDGAPKSVITADVDHNNTRKSHVHHEHGGVVMHCDDLDCEAESNHMEGKST